MTPDQADLQAVLTAIDTKMINLMSPDMSQKLLGASKSRPFSQEVIESKYKPILKSPTKEQYAPTIKFNISGTSDRFYCQFFNDSNDEVQVDHQSVGKLIPTGSRVSSICSMRLWASATGFGVTLNPNQIKIYPRESQLPKICLL
jgi:hypothetical protein